MEQRALGCVETSGCGPVKGAGTRPNRQPGRRVAVRSGVHWDAEYMIVGLPEFGWQPCRIIDVSLWEANVILLGRSPDERYDHELLLRYQRLDDGPAVIELRATIREFDRAPNGDLNVAVEFTDPRPTEQSALRRLLREPPT